MARSSRLGCGVFALAIMAAATAIVSLGSCGWFGGGGDGLGLTDGTDNPPPTEERDAAATDPVSAPVTDRDLVVTVLIDGDTLKRLREGGNPLNADDYQPTDAAAVVAAARRTTGDYGTKVRIYRRNTATPRAEEELRQALRDAGEEESSITRSDELVY